MKFFTDTANLKQFREANDMGVLDGVTTNLSLMTKEGIKGKGAIHCHYVEIYRIVEGDVSTEVIATEYKEMIAGGEMLAASNRHTQHIIQCMESDAEVTTCPLSTINRFLKYPLMNSGLVTFLTDYRKVNS